MDKAQRLANMIYENSGIEWSREGIAIEIRALCDEVILERDIEVYHDLAKAQQDTERLDKLERIWLRFKWWQCYPTLRSAIDAQEDLHKAARAEEEKP